jgi:hypothetical protein
VNAVRIVVGGGNGDLYMGCYTQCRTTVHNLLSNDVHI